MECKDCVIDLNANPSTRRPNAGLICAGVVGGVGLIISCVSIPFITPALRRFTIPYVPASTEQVTNVMKLLKGRKGTLVDLGSGDGRIVHEAAKNGFKAVGVELNPWLVWYSRIQARRLGISSSASFYRQNIWKVSLKPYNNVVIFGVDTMMDELETKCAKEMKPGSVVAACRFPLPNSSPALKYERSEGEGIDRVWLYEISPESTHPNNNNIGDTIDPSKSRNT